MAGLGDEVFGRAENITACQVSEIVRVHHPLHCG
jgi:hypothetical protein